jgi:hypothetical protein
MVQTWKKDCLFARIETFYTISQATELLCAFLFTKIENLVD